MDPSCRSEVQRLHYRVRPISPDDASALNDFHERCSERTHRLRFFSSQAHLPPAMLSLFTNVDHDEREALLAMLGDQIIAVGRYDLVTEGQGDTDAHTSTSTNTDTDTNTGAQTDTKTDTNTDARWAEVAFVVADEFQGNGIASDLLGRLADLARSRSITRFVAETLAENRAMQAVFRKSPYNAVFKRVAGDPSVIQVTMTL